MSGVQLLYDLEKRVKELEAKFKAIENPQEMEARLAACKEELKEELRRVIRRMGMKKLVARTKKQLEEVLEFKRSIDRAIRTPEPEQEEATE